MAILLQFESEIKGDSDVEGHEGWITCDSISFGISRNITISGQDRDTGTSHVQDVSLTKTTDFSSPELAMQASLGASLGMAKIHFTQTAGKEQAVQEYLTFELHDALLSSYDLGAGGDSHPGDSFTLNFTKFSIQYNIWTGKKKKTGDKKNFDIMTQQVF